MIHQCINVLCHQCKAPPSASADDNNDSHDSNDNITFDNSPKAIVWNNFLRTLQSETERTSQLPPPRRSNVRYLFDLFQKFMIKTQDVKLEYNLLTPTMLIGAAVSVRWYRGPCYNAEVEDYVQVEGKQKRMHKFIYEDGDERYYDIDLKLNRDGKYELKAPNNGNEGDLHTIIVRKWQTAAPRDLELEKTYVERCALGNVATVRQGREGEEGEEGKEGKEEEK